MQTETESVSEILRPLAERTVECAGCAHYQVRLWETYDAVDEPCSEHGIEHHESLDPRFDALRALAPTSQMDTTYYFEHGWDIATDLGSIVRCAAACGWYVDKLLPPVFGDSDWELHLHGEDYPERHSFEMRIGFGPTPEHAAANAFVDAMGENYAD